MSENLKVAGPIKATLLLLCAIAMAPAAFAQDWYEASGKPAARSLLNSADFRTEFANIESGLSDKLPALTGNGGNLIAVNSGGTALEAISTGIGVAQGGTGATTLTGLLQGNGTSAVTALNASTVGQVLRVTGSNTYAWGALDLADSDAITGDLPDANLSANVPLLDAQNVFTASAQTTQGDGPQWRLIETDAAAANGRWSMTADGEVLSLRAWDDTWSSQTSFVLVNRTGNTIDEIELNATTFDLNGNADISGSLLLGTALAVLEGGTGATTASGARTNLGVAIGSDVQAWDTDLDAISALADTDGNFIVGNGSTWVAESGAIARASIGAHDASNLTTGTLPDTRLSSNVLLEVSGSFTIDFDNACTTTPSITVDYVQQGNIITIMPPTTNTLTCTSDSASFTDSTAPIPAGLRPSVTFTRHFTKVQDNGTVEDGCIQFDSSGDVSIFRASNLACSGSFTSSGTKGVFIPSFSYVL